MQNDTKYKKTGIIWSAGPSVADAETCNAIPRADIEIAINRAIKLPHIRSRVTAVAFLDAHIRDEIVFHVTSDDVFVSAPSVFQTSDFNIWDYEDMLRHPIKYTIEAAMLYLSVSGCDFVQIVGADMMGDRGCAGEVDETRTSARWADEHQHIFRTMSQLPTRFKFVGNG